MLITNYQMKEGITPRNSRSSPSTQGSMRNSLRTIRTMRLLGSMALTLSCSPCFHPQNAAVMIAAVAYPKFIDLGIYPYRRLLQ